MNLATLRPADATATGIATALTRAQDAQAETTEAVSTAKRHRDGLLLDGSAADLAAAEKTLATARDVAERVDSILAQLAERHAAATRTEALDTVAAAERTAEAADQALAAWWRKEEPLLRATIAEGVRLRAAKSDAVQEWAHQRQHAARRYPDAELPELRPSYGDADDWRDRVRTALDL